MIPTGLFVTGTDTGVGKTVVAAAIAGLLQSNGLDVGVMKPVASGGIREDECMVSQDARFLRKAADASDALDLINPYCFEAPVSPHVAAKLANVNVDPALIRRAFLALAERHDFVIVEGAGGLLVPLNDSFLIADLIQLLGLPAIVVARPNLGTINHTLLTIRCAQQMHIAVAGTVINRYDAQTAGLAEQTSPAAIERLSGLPLLGILPRIRSLDVAQGRLGDLLAVAARSLHLELLHKELGNVVFKR